MSIAFAMAAALVGGTAPYMAAWLIARTGDPTAPGYLLMASAVVTLLTLTTMRETAGKSMPD
jgi:MHS family proline/betaine transporter-like MFS transporter